MITKCYHPILLVAAVLPQPQAAHIFLIFYYNSHMAIGGAFMRKQNLNYALTIKVSEAQRKAVEHLAESRETTLGEAARCILASGMQAMGI